MNVTINLTDMDLFRLQQALSAMRHGPDLFTSADIDKYQAIRRDACRVVEHIARAMNDR